MSRGAWEHVSNHDEANTLASTGFRVVRCRRQILSTRTCTGICTSCTLTAVWAGSGCVASRSEKLRALTLPYTYRTVLLDHGDGCVQSSYYLWNLPRFEASRRRDIGALLPRELRDEGRRHCGKGTRAIILHLYSRALALRGGSSLSLRNAGDLLA